MGSSTAESRSPAEPADVIEALGRVLDSPQFARSPRARGFLAYVVTETVSGRGDRLSERTVARGALERGADFDGRDDASVRVQARRVRQYLEDFYAGEGADEPLRIVLPRGSYVPSFEPATAHASTVASVPGVVVSMLSWSGDEPAAVFARSMSESLVQSLAAHTHIRVVGPIDSPSDVRRSAAASGVSSILTGHVNVREGRLSLGVRVVDADSSAVVWSSDASADLDDLSRLEAEELWPREIASRVGDPSGVVIREELKRERPTTEPEHAARMAFYAYLDHGTVASIHEAVAKLDAALDAGHRTAPLLAMRAALANTSSMYDFADREAELDRAESLAREALVRDAGNAHAHLVLSWPVLQHGHVRLAVELAETAARLAPYQPFYLSTAGMALIACGEWHRGSALIREAFRLQPGLSGQTHAWLASVHLAEGDFDRALAEASLLPADDGYVWGPLWRGLALAGLGYDEQARAEFGRARSIRPGIMDELPDHLVALVRMSPEQVERLVALAAAVDVDLRDGGSAEVSSRPASTDGLIPAARGDGDQAALSAVEESQR